MPIDELSPTLQHGAKPFTLSAKQDEWGEWP
ncbi:hypothetical protein ABIC44_001941 [Sphingomonas sp. 1185]